MHVCGQNIDRWGFNRAILLEISTSYQKQNTDFVGIISVYVNAQAQAQFYSLTT